jgi:hypothetical protein
MSGPTKTENSSRFQPGRSGNPKGRPRKAKPELTSAFDVIMDKTFTVSTGGTERELSVDEALQQRIYQDALAGSRTAIRTVMGWIRKREAALIAKQPNRHSIAVLHESLDPRNVDDALILLGIATEQQQPGEVATHRRLLLEPWATQLALSRRGMSAPTRNDLEEAQRCTRDRESIRWPEASGE